MHHKMQVLITQEAFELLFELAVKLLNIHSKTSCSREAKNKRYKDFREVFAIFSFSFRQMNRNIYAKFQSNSIESLSQSTLIMIKTSYPFKLKANK